jgi:hypothetical protein
MNEKDIKELETQSKRDIEKKLLIEQLKAAKAKNELLEQQLKAAVKPTGPKTNGKHPGGRPPKYDPKVHPEMVRLLAAEGTVKEDLWIHFAVDHSTIYDWMKKHPEFSEAYKKGLNHTAKGVNSKMYQQAMGYTKEVIESTYNAKLDKWVDHKVKKYFPPVPSCTIFAQKNLNKWTDKQEIDHSGNINIVTDNDDKDL